MGGVELERLQAEIAATRTRYRVGRIQSLRGGIASVTNLPDTVQMGDMVRIEAREGPIAGEVVAIEDRAVFVLAANSGAGLSAGMRVLHLGADQIAPDESWIGRVLDAFGRPLDGRPLLRGTVPRAIRAAPPPAYDRRTLGPQLRTGLTVFDTLLPLVRGQRIGLFAGSGVGKSTLMAQITHGLDADVFVVALAGERGREVRDFVDRVLGPRGLARSVVVTATADRSPLERRRVALTAMAIAEHFRDSGRHAVYICDSVTRFADAHREIATAAGEAGAVRGHPPSSQQTIASLCERAGPGTRDQGDITAIFTVLVAASDMDEPVADILRGVLDGHIVLDRAIAERGRFPAVDVLRSVSRAPRDALPEAAQRLADEARRALSTFEDAELMLKAGLYTPGSDPGIDWAKAVWPGLDAAIGSRAPDGIDEARAALRAALTPPDTGAGASPPRR